LPEGAHAVTEYLEIARLLGADVENVRFELRPSPESVHRVQELLASRGHARDQPFMVVTPSAAQNWKNWPADRWAGLSDTGPSAIGFVIAGTGAQRARHVQISGAAARRVIDLTGETTLHDLVALLHRAAAHVTSDSGPAHISAALGIPVISLYGPTSPG